MFSWAASPLQVNILYIDLTGGGNYYIKMQVNQNEYKAIELMQKKQVKKKFEQKVSVPKSPRTPRSEKAKRHQDFLEKSKKNVENYQFPLTEQELAYLKDKAITSDDSDQETRRLRQKQDQTKIKKERGRGEKMNKRQSMGLIIYAKKSTFTQQLHMNWEKFMIKLRNCWRKCTKSQQKSSNVPRYIISPDGYPKLMWDLLCMILIFYEIMSIPFKISFDTEISSEFDAFIDICFITDILLNFTTAYYENGVQVTDHKKIILNYLKLWFWIDLISTFPYDQVIQLTISAEEGDSSGSETASTIAQSASLLRFFKFLRFIKIIRLLRLAKLKVIFDKVEEFLQLSSAIAGILSFIQLSVFVLFWAHWLGCIFHYIAIQENNPDSWLASNDLLDTDWSIRYVNSLYWAVTTMNTVGYGDLSPQTPLERLFGILLLLIACGVFAFTMNSIGAALQQIDQKKSENRHRLSNVNNYMKKANIPNELQCRVRRYLEFIWDSDRNMTLEDLIANLSNELKHTLLLEVNGNMLGYCDVICETFDNNFLLELTLILKEQTFFPQEYVFRETEEYFGEKNLYIVQSGEVDLFYEKTNIVIDKKFKNEYFGEIAFFTNSRRTASAKSVNFTNLFYIKQSGFQELVHQFPKDHEKFCDLKDSIIFYDDYSGIGTRCYMCQMDDHIGQNCPHLHFKIYAPHYLSALMTCIKVQQSLFVRKDRIDFNALKHRKLIQDAADGFNKIQSRRIEFQNKNLCNIVLIPIPYPSQIDEDNENHNIEDQNLELKMQPLQTEGKIQTKFKAEREQKKKKKILDKQFSSIARSNSDPSNDDDQSQDEQFLHKKDFVEDELAQDKDKEQQSEEPGQAAADNQEQNSEFKTSDEEEKLDNLIYERMNEIVQNLQDEKKEKDKNLLWKEFGQIPNFEKYSEYDHYFPRNNLSNVLFNYKNVQSKGMDCLYGVIPEMNEQELKEYLDFYAIDIKDIQLTQFLKKEQNANFLNVEQHRIRKLQRTQKKKNNYISIPKINKHKAKLLAAQAFKMINPSSKASSENKIDLESNEQQRGGTLDLYYLFFLKVIKLSNPQADDQESQNQIVQDNFEREGPSDNL